MRKERNAQQYSRKMWIKTMKSGWTSWSHGWETMSEEAIRNCHSHRSCGCAGGDTEESAKTRGDSRSERGSHGIHTGNGMIQGVLRRSMTHTRRSKCRNPNDESGAAGQAVQVQRQARRGNGAQGGGHGRGDAGGLSHVHGVRVHALRQRPIERVDHARHEKAHLQ